MARHEGLDCLADVRKEHLKLLRTMHAVGLNWAEKFLSEDASLILRLGYHSVCITSCSKSKLFSFSAKKSLMFLSLFFLLVIFLLLSLFKVLGSRLLGGAGL